MIKMGIYGLVYPNIIFKECIMEKIADLLSQIGSIFDNFGEVDVKMVIINGSDKKKDGEQ